ncbi:MAG: hypothetical protein GXO62_08690 [Epsilonproteobacteria bacterium]|nr:hypothetical protein [Campylobacterota bacterium]
MKIAALVKNNELCDYPGDLLVDGEIKKSYNLEFELHALGVKMVIAKSLPSQLIKKLRDSGIIFLKLSSLEEAHELDLDVGFLKEFKNKRGWKCAKKGF